MPGELFKLDNSQLPSTAYKPLDVSSYFSSQTPAARAVDTSAQSAAIGNAGILDAVNSVIKTLPVETQKSYLQGQEIARHQQALGLRDQALRGALSEPQAVALNGATIADDGSMSYRVPGPNAAKLAALELQSKEANIALQQAHAKSYDPTSSANSNPLFGAIAQDELKAGGGLSSDGKITSYAYPGDTYGGPKAKSSTTGAWDNPLDDNSLAVSQDKAAELKAAGVKPMDWVKLHLSDGSTVIKQYADHVATDDEAAALNLPPLRGRWDIRSTGGKHEKDGVRVVGFSKASGPNEAPEDAAESTPLPEGEYPADHTPGETKKFKTADGGTAYRSGAGFIKEMPDGSRSYVAANSKGGKPAIVALQKRELNYPKDVRELMNATGYTPKPGETAEQARQNAIAHGAAHSQMTPLQDKEFDKWEGKMVQDATVKNYNLAATSAEHVAAAASVGNSAAAALGILDNFTKAMTGGRATIGMAQLTSDSQTWSQKLALKWQGMTGGYDANAKLSPEMSKDIQDIVNKIRDVAAQDLHHFTAESVKYLQGRHNVPAINVINRMNMIERGVQDPTEPTGQAGGDATPPEDQAALDWISKNENSTDPAIIARIKVVREHLATKGQ